MTNTSPGSAGDPSFFTEKLTRRQNMTKRLLLAMAATTAVALAAVAWQYRAPAETPLELSPGNPPLAVTTLVAQPVESYTRQRNYTGIVREARRSELSFQRAGEVVEVVVDEGAEIDAGQVLARLDERHVRARRAQLTAQVKEAQAVLAELLAGPRQETIAAKRAELRALESQAAVLAKQLARREQLVQAASVSREEYETFLFQHRAAQARADVARRQLEELLAGTRDEQIAAQRARLAQLDAQLTDVAHDLEDTKLTAPFAGRVAGRRIDEGTVVAAGAPVLEVIDDRQLESWVGLPTAAAAVLEVGDEYPLTVDGKAVAARVHSLAPDVDRTTRTRNVILRLNAAATDVLPGQVVRLAVREEVKQSGYWVPTTALVHGVRGLWSLFVVETTEGAEVIARRDVELLDTVGAGSFVRGTLQPGDRIVASGTHRVVIGQRVTTEAEKLAQELYK